MCELLNVSKDVTVTWGEGGATDDSTGTSDSILISLINELLESYKGLVVGGLAFATLTMILIGIYLLINMGACSTNPVQRTSNMKRIVIWAVCMALLGSLDLVVCLVYNTFR